MSSNKGAAFLSFRLLKEVLQLTLLLFGGARKLVRGALGLLGFFADHDAGGLCCPAFKLVHHSFVRCPPDQAASYYPASAITGYKNQCRTQGFRRPREDLYFARWMYLKRASTTGDMAQERRGC